MIPLCVRAHLANAIALPWHALGLDALLMAAVALRENLPPLGWGQEPADIPIPVAKSACGRLYLASSSLFERDTHEKRWITKRFPIAEAQCLGEPALRRVNLAGGLSKNYRLPLETFHTKGDAITWYALGEAEPIRALLRLVRYLGKKRSVGNGRVTRWEVVACEPWDGFPVLRQGRPLRPLPLDWPGLGEHRIDYRVLAPPYWQRWREEETAV